MRLSSLLPIFGALSAAGLLALGAASFSARAIERTTMRAVETQLELEGFEWTDVATDGLQVVLMGTAPNESSQLAAQRTAGHVVDAARVINVMTVEQQDAVPAPRFSIEILRNDRGISLIGLVPADWNRDAFINDLKRASNTGGVVDLLEQADYMRPDNWDAAMDFGVDAIKSLPRSKISLSADAINVTGLADSTQQKATFERRLKNNAPDDVPTQINITAPRPVITPFTTRFLMDENGARFDACTAETPLGHARILAAATSFNVTNPSCVVGLGSPSPDWAAAVETSMGAVHKMEGGSVTISDADISLIGPEGLSQNAFERIAAELEADLPEAFSLHATWTPEANTDEDEALPEFTVVRSPEGQVQLRGRVRDERSRIATEALASAAFGSQAVYAAMSIDDSLPASWSTRTMTSIDVLGRMNQGSVTVQEGTISVQGQTGDPAAKAEITRLLAARLGDGQTYDIDVQYVRKLDPILNLPTPAKCVADVNTAIKDGKIIFAPGSTDVDSSADDTLDRIAKGLEDCENMSMEIGGHTDSQGGESMNAQLSQARANSVLDALISRNVFSVKFTARGYGESEPIADNGTEAGREANRRIEFKLTGDSVVNTAPAPDDEAAESAADEGTNE